MDGMRHNVSDALVPVLRSPGTTVELTDFHGVLTVLVDGIPVWSTDEAVNAIAGRYREAVNGRT